MILSPHLRISLKVLVERGCSSCTDQREFASEASALNPVTLLGPCGPSVISWLWRLNQSMLVQVTGEGGTDSQQASVVNECAIELAWCALNLQHHQ